MKLFSHFFLFAGCLLHGLSAPAQTAARSVNPEKAADGMIVNAGGVCVKAEVWASNIIRIAAAKDRAFFSNATPATQVRRREKAEWKVSSRDGAAILSTAAAEVRVDMATGAVAFFNSRGEAVLAEKPGGRQIVAARVQDEDTQHIEQQWQPNAGESLHGLGQLQFGVMDIKGYDLDLWQHNTCVVVPLLVSSRGYGIYWDNLSFSRFGDLRPWEDIPGACLCDDQGNPGALSTHRMTAAELGRDRTAHPEPAWTCWSGSLVPQQTGDHQIRIYSNGGTKMWLDGNLLVDHWRQNWLTENDQVKVHLEAGHHYSLRIEHGGDQATTIHWSWKTPSSDNSTTLWSEVGDGVDYYFIYGPEIDKVIAGYRQITGRASMMPEWAFGLWQSRQRFETAQQGLDVLNGYRRRGIPLDNLVQDWQYWKPDSWGSHEFDPARFPDPDGWIKAIHDLHAHVMISVWGKFYPGTSNFNALQAAGYLYQPNLDEHVHDWINHPFTFYDAFNPGARKLYWDQINRALFAKGIDTWWEDATEPDLTDSPPTLENSRAHIKTTAMGTASRVINAYALMNSMGIYEGQRGAATNQRVFVLTRSGFGGIQRYATATWSGDTTSTWTGLKKQIAAGLGYSISGTPYWSMDSGGYTMFRRFSERPNPQDLDEWNELNTRWFQFAAFCPFTRLHGELRHREPWEYGGDDSPASHTIVKFDHLRYRLLPYIYSLAGAAALDDGTLMRPLVMDFPRDPVAREITDQYMFGPAFLVAPVTEYQARKRPVHLPETKGGWYDFWTGTNLPGSQTIDAPAPFDASPLYIRAGSIIPAGPDLQYTGEKPADPVTLCIYAGADGAFSLYEDDGLTYACDKGAFARIPIRWDDAKKTLTIGKREGSFPGMLQSRTFNIVLTQAGKPSACSFDAAADKTIRYSGTSVTETFK
jgi:alpha-D-xyloside xylohydrolase